jgi:serine/threonine-protein kinase
LAVLEQRGQAAAQEFIARAGMNPELVDDESRVVPFELWCRALDEFERLCGPDALENTAPHFVHRENLGVWMRVLRGAASISDAYRQLEFCGVEFRAKSDWTTFEQGDFFWRGGAPLPRHLAFETAALVTRARSAELRSVPLLFGYPPAKVESRHVAAEGMTHFEVRWTAPREGAPLLGAVLGLTLAFPLSLWLALGILPLILGLSAAGLFGYLMGFVLRGNAQRAAHARAQMLRIACLERSAELREQRDAAGATFENGTIIAGQFRLGAQIGSGASGAIWEAERITDGCRVALKLLRTAVAHDSLAADRLRREADALGLSWHPNVVELLDDGHLPSGVAYIVMERLHGESLASRLEGSGPLTVNELHDIALEACDALEAIHAAGVVHRDIKPSNLFLAKDAGGGVRLKLVDFGVAQIAWAETRLTRSGTALGTPGYMAPEQEEGGVVDGRSDLYALGGVFYEALSGSPPPITVPITSPSTFAHLDRLESIEPGFRAIIRRLLAPWPHQRFNDARALREALLSRTDHLEEETRASA